MRNDEIVAEFERLYAELVRRGRGVRFEPNADAFVTEDGSAIVVTVEIAGVDPDELRVAVDGETLYIVGQRTNREPHGRCSLLLKEIEYGEFAKKIHLPAGIVPHDATAVCRDGILTIRLPVAERRSTTLPRTEIKMIVRRIPF